jgi:hypothetical protein
MRGLHAGHKFEIKAVGAYWQVSIDGVVREDAPPFIMLASALDWAKNTIAVMVQGE